MGHEPHDDSRHADEVDGQRQVDGVGSSHGRTCGRLCDVPLRHVLQPRRRGVADLLYRQVTDDPFTVASEVSEDAQRQAPQYAAEPTRTDSQAASESLNFSEECDEVRESAKELTGQSGIRTRESRFCKPIP
jgi:hypothetical protein